MKTKQKQTGKSTIDRLREIRDEISAETQDLTFEQFQKYVDERLTVAIHPQEVRNFENSFSSTSA